MEKIGWESEVIALAAEVGKTDLLMAGILFVHPTQTHLAVCWVVMYVSDHQAVV